MPCMMDPKRCDDSSRRQFLASSGATLTAGLVGNAWCQAATPALRLRLIGQTHLPHKMQYRGTTVGGLSGIDYDPASGTYYLLSDDGGSISPPRFYTARMALTADKLGNVELTGVTLLQGVNAPDPEAIRWHAPSQTLLWTSEGNPVRFTSTALHQSRTDGSLLRTFSLPAMFDFGVLTGARINKTLEGLAIAPDGKTAWLAMEAALRQDGEEPALGSTGGSCRFTQMDVASGKILRQIAYLADAIPRAPSPPDANSDNGVVEVLMLDAHRMLVLERAYMAGLNDRQRNSIRLHVINTRQVTNTSSIAALQPGNHIPAAKTLVADFASFPLLTRLDNTEGRGHVLGAGAGGRQPHTAVCQ